MENRRLLLAAFLSLVVLIGWSFLFPPTPPSRTEPIPAMDDRGGETVPLDETVPLSETASLGDTASRAGQSDRPFEAAAEVAGEQPLETAAPPPSLAAEVETPVVVETEIFRAQLTNRGAQLRSFLLKEHLDVDGEPLELIRARGKDPYPFGLMTADGRPHPLNDALFVLEREGRGAGEEVLRFRHSSEAGAAEKVFRIYDDGLIEAEITVNGERGWSFILGPGVRNLSTEELGSRFLQRMAAYVRGGEEEELDARKTSEDQIIPASGLRRVTLEDNFFLVAVVHESSLSQVGVSEVVLEPVLQHTDLDPATPRFLPLVEAGEGEEEDQHDLLLQVRASAPTVRATTYFGAKTFDTLAELPYGLEETVRWGFFGFLARPLYHGLQWIYENVVANYGWAIVLMTFLIKLVFAPLTHKSQKSMGKMQEINPKIKALQARYRHRLKDKQGRPNMEARRQMNEETMALYREAGVNPAGGCLPILLQIPVFFAFFRLLSAAVELRNAPWLLWVKDLSAPDPLYLLPIAMGVTGILLQRITPSAPDPMQRRMMQFMPIMFAFFAITFPSGLVLYWLTNNLLTMVQQSWYMKRKAKQESAVKTERKKARDGE